MTLEYRKFIIRKHLHDEPEKLFAFGDNIARKGLGGQAAACRGEPNAVGIPTKWKPSMTPDSFFSDADLEFWLKESYQDRIRLLDFKGIIVWPSNGIGTGLACLPIKAPRIYAEIKQLERILNG